jgi:cysteinyl-tRNA synthetase
MKIFNSKTRSKETFVPRNPNRITMYVCGPTVYNHAHIGNARPAVVFDLLFRVLRHKYGNNHVIYARNITDIDDKIIQKASQEGVDYKVIAERYTDIYRQDMASVGVLRPPIEPLATNHIPAMIDMIVRLIKNGHAYVSEGHVLFDVDSYPDHGVFSNGSDDEAESRIGEVSYKRDQKDFVLWKPSKPGEPAWESPWGAGRPGWHIECSAMIEANLGLPIDIHGGGIDLAFPHHENEISQGLCAQGHCGHNHEYSRYWMHNEFLTNNGKMSKSVGNVVLVHDLVKEWDGEIVRLALLSAHYRTVLNWTPELLQTTKNRLDGYYAFLRQTAKLTTHEVPVPQSFLDHLHDDLNTPLALAELSSLMKPETKSEFVAAAQLLGVLNHRYEDWFKNVSKDEREIIEGLIYDRNLARAGKDWVMADIIRNALAERGVTLLDTKEGTDWFV